VVWLSGQELGRNMIVKLVTRNFEGKVCGEASLNEKKM
jgi:hypothetical protein